MGYGKVSPYFKYINLRSSGEGWGILYNGIGTITNNEIVLFLGFNITPSTVTINCTSYYGASNFSMTWQPQDKRDFTVIVYPNQTFNNTTPVTFQYEHEIPFNISIIQQDCTENIITTFLLSMLKYPIEYAVQIIIMTSLIFTGCRLLNNYCSNVTYTVHVNGNMSARLVTVEGEILLICVNNDWWKVEFSNTTYNIGMYFLM